LTAIRPRQVRAFTLLLIDPGHALNRQAGAILFLPSAGTGLVFRTSPFDRAASPDAWPAVRGKPVVKSDSRKIRTDLEM
jgi:hypothetical protein